MRPKGRMGSTRMLSFTQEDRNVCDRMEAGQVGTCSRTQHQVWSKAYPASNLNSVSGMLGLFLNLSEPLSPQL